MNDRLGVDASVVCTARKRAGIPPLHPRHVWTKREDRLVRELYARSGFARGPLEALAAQLGRTWQAVHTRMCGLGLPRMKAPKPRWPKTVNDLVREWGYARTRIVIAADRAGVTLARGPRRSYIVTEEQATAIRAELAKHLDGTRLHRVQHGEWGLGGHPPACIDCGRSDRPRHARDRCAACDHLTRTA